MTVLTVGIGFAVMAVRTTVFTKAQQFPLCPFLVGPMTYCAFKFPAYHVGFVAEIPPEGIRLLSHDVLMAL